MASDIELGDDLCQCWHVRNEHSENFCWGTYAMTDEDGYYDEFNCDCKGFILDE
ncbi:hypothetical protein SEA_KEELAN_141 [Gordonia phage Keelan]|nr:hypothetical protein SEA_KEELAN_141 [Gordonia phage Keelan]